MDQIPLYNECINHRKKRTMSALRILHTSDHFLGINFSGADTRRDQLSFLDQIYEIVKQKNIDAVIIAGDIYDRSIASADAIALYDSAMTKLCGELGVPSRRKISVVPF